MATFDDLIAKFFVNSGDRATPPEPGQMVPDTSAGNVVTHLIDGANYFGAIRTEMTRLNQPGGTGKFFYFSDWWLALNEIDAATAVHCNGTLKSFPMTMQEARAFVLDDMKNNDPTKKPYPNFITELESMGINGVDVRALVWVNPGIMKFREAAMRADEAGLWQVNAQNVRSAVAMRGRPSLAQSVCLNTLAHPLGAMHLKFVICGDDSSASAFVSGFDFVANRVDNQHHPNGWHDIGIQVAGPAAKTVYLFFATLWNAIVGSPFDWGEPDSVGLDNVDIPAFVRGTSQVAVDRKPDPFVSPGTAATAHVQVLRTVPQFNIGWTNTPLLTIPPERLGFLTRQLANLRHLNLAFAPDGIFEFQLAVTKAINHAENYIYVEDQDFCNQELMGVIASRMRAAPNLKVIFLHGADPADGKNLSDTAAAFKNLGSDPALTSRIAFWERLGCVIHSKSWIIDDALVIIGSGNFMRRSFYTDGECSLSVLDETVLDETTGTLKFAVDFRKHLWGEHAGLDEAHLSLLDDVNASLPMWKAAWATGPPALTLDPSKFSWRDIPFTVGTGPGQWPFSSDIPPYPKIDYDQQDPDSRFIY